MIQSLTHFLRFLGDALLDTLYPEECLYCHADGALLCTTCVHTAPLSPQLLCLGCGIPTRTGRTHATCTKRSAVDLYASAVAYEVPFTSLVSSWKYHGVVQLTPLLAGFLRRLFASHALLRELVADQAVPVFPVPLHVTKYRLRGFNQSTLLAHALFDDKRVDTTLLVRTSKGIPQAQVHSRTRRLTNVLDVYQLRVSKLQNHPHGRFALLLDDVATTGATLNACARLLKQTGYTYVAAVTLAHGT